MVQCVAWRYGQISLIPGRIFAAHEVAIKYIIFLLKGFSNLLSSVFMPNQHAPDKETIAFYGSRTLSKRVRKAAKQRKLTLTSFIEETLTHATSHIELTPEDYREIAEATQRAIDKQSLKGVSGKAAQDGRSGRGKKREQSGSAATSK